jgi:uncharacterized protein (TIGR03083 family)
MTETPGPAATASPELVVLRDSVAALRRLVADLTGQQLRRPAYPSEWTIAEVLSHLGSAGVINLARLAAARRGEVLPADFAPPVWEEWNAKSPEQQMADSLAVDADLMAALEAVTPQERASLQMPMGPIVMDVDQLVGFRLAEHAMHSWDIAVVLDPGATVDPAAIDSMVDRLGPIIGWTAKSDGRPRVVGVHTTDPQRDFAVTITADAVQLALTDEQNRHDVDLTLPAEAFVRLVYGRLDPEHAPASLAEVSEVAALRSVFPGV